MAGFGDTEAYTFDAYGRPATHTMTWNSVGYTIRYAFNTLGKLDTLTYPLVPSQTNPFVVKYGYSNGYLSLLQNFTGGTGGTTFWKLTPSVVNMDPWGHVVDETLGTTTTVRIQSAFDAVTSWLNTRQVGSGGSSNNIQNLGYGWDLNGNMNNRQDLKQSLTEAISYDNLNRIGSSTLNGTQNLSVSIDNTGNITQRIEGGITYPYTYDPTHKHAVATVGTGGNQTAYSYDANGNMNVRGGAAITWTSYNLPATINGSGGVSATFSYGPDRQRKLQTATYNANGDVGTEQTIYVAGLYEIETTPSQIHYKHFVQVPGGTQIIYDIQSVAGAQTTYITADHLGSGNILLSSAGSVEINESYSAYGYRRSSNWSGPLSPSSGDYSTIASTTRRGYTGAFHEMLDNVGLVHMNGRVYDPVIGRFNSPDAIGAPIGDSQAGNPYSYVSNRSLAAIDPTGYEEQMIMNGDPGSNGSGNAGNSSPADTIVVEATRTETAGTTANLSTVGFSSSATGLAEQTGVNEITVTATRLRPKPTMSPMSQLPTVSIVHPHCSTGGGNLGETLARGGIAGFGLGAGLGALAGAGFAISELTVAGTTGAAAVDVALAVIGIHEIGALAMVGAIAVAPYAVVIGVGVAAAVYAYQASRSRPTASCASSQ